MKAIGLDRRVWTTNLRASAVTQLNAQGVKAEEIKMLGAWQSLDSVYAYLKTDYRHRLLKNQLL